MVQKMLCVVVMNVNVTGMELSIQFLQEMAHVNQWVYLHIKLAVYYLVSGSYCVFTLATELQSCKWVLICDNNRGRLVVVNWSSVLVVPRVFRVLTLTVKSSWRKDVWLNYSLKTPYQVHNCIYTIASELYLLCSNELSITHTHTQLLTVKNVFFKMVIVLIYFIYHLLDQPSK